MSRDRVFGYSNGREKISKRELNLIDMDTLQANMDAIRVAQSNQEFIPGLAFGTQINLRAIEAQHELPAEGDDMGGGMGGDEFGGGDPMSQSPDMGMDGGMGGDMGGDDSKISLEDAVHQLVDPGCDADTASSIVGQLSDDDLLALTTPKLKDLLQTRMAPDAFDALQQAIEGGDQGAGGDDFGSSPEADGTDFAGGAPKDSDPMGGDPMSDDEDPMGGSPMGGSPMGAFASADSLKRFARDKKHTIVDEPVKPTKGGNYKVKQPKVRESDGDPKVKQPAVRDSDGDPKVKQPKVRNGEGDPKVKQPEVRDSDGDPKVKQPDIREGGELKDVKQPKIRDASEKVLPKRVAGKVQFTNDWQYSADAIAEAERLGDFSLARTIIAARDDRRTKAVQALMNADSAKTAAKKDTVEGFIAPNQFDATQRLAFDATCKKLGFPTGYSAWMRGSVGSAAADKQFLGEIKKIASADIGGNLRKAAASELVKTAEAVSHESAMREAYNYWTSVFPYDKDWAKALFLDEPKAPKATTED
jgi:hypothetical protein